MHASPNRLFTGLLAAAAIVAGTQPGRAIETTYGEDPVPTTGFFKEYINLGYGIDPIPRKSLLQRWAAWRASRNLPQAPLFQNAPALSDGVIQPIEPRPSSRH